MANENFEPNDSANVKNEPEIIVNDYGATKDSTVVVEEATRTVLLTEDETLIIEKTPHVDIVPKNRPRKVYAGMWGQSEIATVGLGMLAMLAMIILIVLVVMPAQKELDKNKAERDRLQTELTATQKKYGDITSTEAQVAKLMSSVDDFEGRFLSVGAFGKSALYQRVNGLIGAYNLVNTTGPDYAPLEIADARRGGQQSEAERGRTKFQSLFPGVYVTMTVEGSYQNLRRFIRELETGNQFVVISAVEFQPAESDNKQNDSSANAAQTQNNQSQINNVRITPNNPANPNYPVNPNYGNPNPNNLGQQMPGQQMNSPYQQQTTTVAAKPAAARGKTHGETVSLRLEMAAYFRRPVAQQTQLDNTAQ